jgi:uncharacterized protein with PQ loop repeat
MRAEDAEDVMGYAAVFFGILGSWGLYRQTCMIWVNKSVQSVSGIWTIIFLAMFASLFIYGAQQGSFPMKFQGGLRVVFSLPVMLGFFVYGAASKKHWALVCACAILLAGMVGSRAISPWLFILFSFLGIGASLVQAYTIWQNRSRGKVVVELQLIYLAAILCWLVYGLLRHDDYLVTISVGFILSYLATIVMWFRYP